MAKKIKEPPFADWQIVLGSDGGYSESLTIRATSVAVIEGTVYLQDVRGGVLFMAPRVTVRYVRRLEPGTALAEPAQAVSGAPASGPPLTGPPPTASESIAAGAPAPKPPMTSLPPSRGARPSRRAK